VLGHGETEARVVDSLSCSLAAGRTLGIVGESGCGKSMTALALMGLLPAAARAEGQMLLAGTDLLRQPREARRRMRGKRLAMVFQEPMTALNPVVPVGTQIAEMLVVHEGATGGAARRGEGRCSSSAGSASPPPRRGRRPIRTSSPAACASV
jgi:ABC-type glutathione transport system ATPase component